MKHRKKNELIICDGIPDAIGWYPVKHMISLMHELFESRIIKLPRHGPNRFLRLLLSFGKTRERNEIEGPNLLIIVPTLDSAYKFFSLTQKTNAYNKIGIWIFDSFWTNRIPFHTSSKYFDQLFVTSGNDVSFYKKKTNINTSFLGWGSDVLRLGGPNGDRNVDVLRVGRQPNRFANDQANKNKFKSLNLTYQGRPDSAISYIDLMNKYYLQAKYILAHSNFADDSEYTHPSKEYITGRWTDALACGCTIIGEQPKSDYAYQKYIWPESVLDIDSNDRCTDGSNLIDCIKNWSSKTAEYNYMMALKHLDWRWRFQELSDFFCIDCQKLDNELRDIKNIFAHYSQFDL